MDGRCRDSVTLLAHQLLESDHEAGPRTDFAHGQHHAGHEAGAVDGVMSDRKRLSLTAEKDLLVSNEAGQPHRVNAYTFHKRATEALSFVP